MNVNHTDFTILKPSQELFLVRYSQSPHPDYINVKFKYHNHTKGIVEIEKTNPSGKKSIMDIGEQKAVYRLFYDKLEMAKALFECFVKREIDDIPIIYKDLINESQDIRPEIWV